MDRKRSVNNDTSGTLWRYTQLPCRSGPASAISKVKLEAVRFSVTAKNLITFTKYSGLDPEFADSGIYTIGYDGCSFPNPRSVQFAVSFTF